MAVLLRIIVVTFLLVAEFSAMPLPTDMMESTETTQGPCPVTPGARVKRSVGDAVTSVTKWVMIGSAVGLVAACIGCFICYKIVKTHGDKIPFNKLLE